MIALVSMGTLNLGIESAEQSVFNIIMEYQQSAILEHLITGLPAEEAPGVGALLQHVEAVARSGIRRTGDFSKDVADEAVSKIFEESWDKLRSGSILTTFDPEGGSQLATFLARFAGQRAIDIVNRQNQETLRDRRHAADSEPAETRFVEALEPIQLSLCPDRRMTRPLQCLCAQMNDRLDWEDHEELKEQFIGALQLEIHEWQQIWESARNVAKEKVSRLSSALQTSVSHNLGMAPDPLQESASQEDLSAEADNRQKDSESQRATRRRRHSRVVRNRTRVLKSAAVEFAFFPLQAADILQIFGLSSSANAQQMRSRSRGEFSQHLTTGDEDEDLLLQQLTTVRDWDDDSTLDQEEDHLLSSSETDDGAAQ